MQLSGARSEEHSGEGKVSGWNTQILWERRQNREEVEGEQEWECQA